MVSHGALLQAPHEPGEPQAWFGRKLCFVRLPYFVCKIFFASSQMLMSSIPLPRLHKAPAS